MFYHDVQSYLSWARIKYEVWLRMLSMYTLDFSFSYPLAFVFLVLEVSMALNSVKCYRFLKPVIVYKSSIEWYKSHMTLISTDILGGGYVKRN